MTPQIVHRYTWPIREAIEHLLDDVVGDCTAWQVRIEGDDLVIDVVEPGPVMAGEIDRSPEKQAEFEARTASFEAAKISTPAETPAEPPRKGGALARTAGIICGEKGFWTFIAKKYGVSVTSADEAADWLRMHCGVASRALLDHDDANAAIFREIDGAYRLWLDGFD